MEDEDQNDIFYELFANDAGLTIEDNMINDNINAEPSYPGASVNVVAFMLLMTFSTKHNLIGDGVGQPLKIIALALPNRHQLCTSLHSFIMYFRNLHNPLIKHYYWARCFAYQQIDICMKTNGDFLKPLQGSFMKLKDGNKCFSPEREEFLSKCFLLAATAVLPSRSLLLQ